MKNCTTYIIVLIFKITIGYGQIDSSWAKNWDKILISEANGGDWNFNHEYQILRENMWITNQNKPDSMITQINPDLIDSIFHSLENKGSINNDPLAMFNLDSIWLINNAEQLWTAYSHNRKVPPEINLIAINIIKDYSRIKPAISRLEGTHWTDDYPLISIEIIKGLDTLNVSVFGQYPFMLPWYVDGHPIYNSGLSKLISQLLPDNSESNKSRLRGEGFNYYLMESIYYRYIEDTVEYTKARNRYKRQFKYLEKEFQIKHAEMSLMASIEWGGLVGRPCLELSLTDSSISDHIQFSTIFSWLNVIHSPKSIVRNKDKLIGQLKDNPVYNYTLHCEHCIGEIHWVKSKSLSGEAKRAFLNDSKANGISKRKFRGKFKHAIFFELTEYRDSNSSFSRWIFLKDGTIVLWELRGDYLMNLPTNMIINQGYICRIMKPLELKTVLNKQ